MIRDSDMIFTVSRTSARQLYSIYGITGIDIKKQEYNASLSSGKIRIVGTGVDRLTVDTGTQKDIDFFALDAMKSSTVLIRSGQL